MNHDLLAADTAMGPVTLLVADLDAMTRYYRDAVTLSVLSDGDAASRSPLGESGAAASRATHNTVTLGRGTTPVIVLEHSPELARSTPMTAGLFHTAILFETQTSLAAAVHSVATHSPGTFTGSSDHLVSQAFYFTDPEGNGIELYWDRDRTEWSWTHGQVEMATLYLDPNEFLREHLTDEAIEQPMLGGASVGHVHLQVGDTASAREFYVDRLGFEATASLGNSALFVSAGGYHHHMAMNTWNSAGAGRRAHTLGLGLVDIVVPTADDLGELNERMSHFSTPARDDGQSLSFEDPWANLIRVRAAHS